MRARRRKRRLIVAASALGICVVLFAGLAFLSQASFLQVTSIAVAGAGAVGSTTIADFARAEMADDYLFVFPKQNIFLYPKSTIAQGLLEKFPTLKTADVHADNFHTVAIAVTERKPVALWCGESAETPEACMLLDENGFAYAPAPEYSGDAFIRFYGTLATTSRQYLAPAAFGDLLPLVQAIAQKEPALALSGVAVDAQNDVHVLFAGGTEVRFGLDDKDTFERFTLVLGAEPFLSRPLSDFEYLDLRFGDRLYYKLKTQ